MYDYFESDKHVFVHGWTAEAVNGDPDWRRSPMKDWTESRWVEWHSKYPNHKKVEGKTVVCGHRGAFEGSRFDRKRPGLCYTPFYGDGMVAIDGTSYKSGIVNVYVTEDEIPENSNYEETLNEAEYRAVSCGNTTVLIRLRDARSLAIRQGDTVTVTCAENDSLPPITVTVTGVYDYPDIEQMRRSHKPETYGLPADKNEIEARLKENLGEENILNLGLTAIRFSLN